MSRLLLLVRHAQSDIRPDRLAGWKPGVNLSEKGRLQAKALAERLAPIPLAALYSSPLERCLQTAQPVAENKGLSIEVVEELGEVRIGRWQGRSVPALVKTPAWRHVQFSPSAFRFPGGESFVEMQARGVSAVETLISSRRRGVVAVFSHADVIKAIVAHYLGVHLDLFQRIVIANASVTAIAFAGGMPRVLRVSDTGTYDDLVPPRSRRGKRA